MKDTVDAYYGATDTQSREQYVTGDGRVMTIYSLVLSSKLKNEFKSICVRHGLSPATIMRDLMLNFIEKYREEKNDGQN